MEAAAVPVVQAVAVAAVVPAQAAKVAPAVVLFYAGKNKTIFIILVL